MQINLSANMRNTIAEEILKAQQDGGILDVEKTAERIRLKHIEDNVALEDIAAALMGAGSDLPMQIGTDIENNTETRQSSAA